MYAPEQKYTTLRRVSGVMWSKRQLRPRIEDNPRARIGLFLKSFLIYFVPAGSLWILLNIGFFTIYLPHAGIMPKPDWLPLSTIFGVFALQLALLSDELSRLKHRK